MNKLKTPLIILSALTLIAGLLYLASNQQISEPFRERSALPQLRDVAMGRVTELPGGSPDSDNRLATANPDAPVLEDLPAQVQQALVESLNRLRQDQEAEVLQELAALVLEYDELDGTNQFALIGGYVNYFLSEGDIDSAVQLYEQALKIPELSAESVVRINRELGQIAFRQGRIDAGVSYFDEYFSNGGEISRVISLTLARALFNSQDYDRAGRYLEQHLTVLAAEGVRVDTNSYAISYAGLADVVLKMENHHAAIQLSKALIQQFNNISNWRNLAEIYRMLGDMDNFQATIIGASDNGYIDGDGNWLD